MSLRLDHQVAQILALERAIKTDQIVARPGLFGHTDRSNAQKRPIERRCDSAGTGAQSDGDGGVCFAALGQRKREVALPTQARDALHLTRNTLALLLGTSNDFAAGHPILFDCDVGDVLIG